MAEVQNMSMFKMKTAEFEGATLKNMQGVAGGRSPSPLPPGFVFCQGGARGAEPPQEYAGWCRVAQPPHPPLNLFIHFSGIQGSWNGLCSSISRIMDLQNDLRSSIYSLTGPQHDLRSRISRIPGSHNGLFSILSRILNNTSKKLIFI